MKRFVLIIAISLLIGLAGSLTLALFSLLNNNVSSTPPLIYAATSLHKPKPSNFVKSTLAPSEAQSGVRILSSGNAYIPEIALTFDDGPNPYYTPQVLAILQQENIKATFFDIGRQVAAYPELVRQEYNAGHIVGNHTWTHADLTTLSAANILSQLSSTSDIIESTIGVRPTFFRPPYGLYNYQVLAQAGNLGMTTITWNADARDWTLPGIKIIVSRILNEVHDGTIILLHDGGGNRSQTVAALPIIIADLQQEGFKFVTIQQMVEDLNNPPVVGPVPTISPTPTLPITRPTPIASPIIPTPTRTPTPITNPITPTPISSPPPDPTPTPSISPTPQTGILPG